MDELSRGDDTQKNPALMLALAWHRAGAGKGEKDMVIIPYKDQLELLSKYLQQLVMESLGKEFDRDGNRVRQGIAVYGNKGSTDQHAYIQQLRDGPDNFFATFIEVRKTRASPGDGVAGDYLEGFLRGTRRALYEGGRNSITISLPTLDAYHLGALIALYERAVTCYAAMVNVNAYHQPGVEAGKDAAEEFIELLEKVRSALGAPDVTHVTAPQIAAELGAGTEDVFHCLNHLAANTPGIRAARGATPSDDTFSASS